MFSSISHGNDTKRSVNEQKNFFDVDKSCITLNFSAYCKIAVDWIGLDL